MIQDHSDHGTSKEPKDPCPEWTELSVSLMHHDLRDLGSLISPDPDHPKGKNDRENN